MSNSCNQTFKLTTGTVMAYSPCQQQETPVKSSQVQFTTSSAAEYWEWQLDLLAGKAAEDSAKYWHYDVHGLHQHWQKPCVSIADGVLTIYDWENVFRRIGFLR